MTTLIKNCSGHILAGGENTRMPVLKAFIEIEGRRLIERNLRTIRHLFKENFIITNQPERYTYCGVPMLGDIYNTRGPMTGILTALTNSPDSWVFISACDMPFINATLIRYMASKRNKCDAVVPLMRNRMEPLFAFYSTRVAGLMEEAVLQGKKSMRDFLRDKRVQYITTKEIREIDPDAVSFINLNTPADVDLYLRAEDKVRFKRNIERRGTCLA